MPHFMFMDKKRGRLEFTPFLSQLSEDRVGATGERWAGEVRVGAKGWRWAGEAIGSAKRGRWEDEARNSTKGVRSGR